MTRPTEAELAAKSARNRKAKAETLPHKLLIDRANELRKMLGGNPLDDDVAQEIVNDVRNPSKPALVAQVKNGKVGKPIIPTEHQEQCAVIAWCDQHPIAKHIFAIPNGAHKSPATAAKFKREGLRKGVPDLFLPIPSKGYHGLFLELKRERGGAVSENQKIWLGMLSSAGYCCHIVSGSEIAIAVIQEYLDIKET